jgi:hypothetical protein
MNTRDLILVGVGVALGFFVKRTLDNRNVVASTDGTGVQTLPSDENFVFSQKYKDCEASISQEMAQEKYAGIINLDAIKKAKIDSCMNRA